MHNSKFQRINTGNKNIFLIFFSFIRFLKPFIPTSYKSWKYNLLDLKWIFVSSVKRKKVSEWVLYWIRSRIISKCQYLPNCKCSHAHISISPVNPRRTMWFSLGKYSCGLGTDLFRISSQWCLLDAASGPCLSIQTLVHVTEFLQKLLQPADSICRIIAFQIPGVLDLSLPSCITSDPGGIDLWPPLLLHSLLEVDAMTCGSSFNQNVKAVNEKPAPESGLPTRARPG